MSTRTVLFAALAAVAVLAGCDRQPESGAAESRTAQSTVAPQRDETSPDGSGERDATSKPLRGDAREGGVALNAVPAEPIKLYDINFEDPPHTADTSPAIGGGMAPRDEITEITFGTPVVVRDPGASTNQRLKFDSTDGVGDQVRLTLSDHPARSRYVTECDVLIAQNTGRNRFVIFHDTITIRNIEFIDGVISVFVPDVTAPWPGSPIGSYTLGEPIHVRVEIDLIFKVWRVFLDGRLAHAGSFGDATKVVQVRISTDVVGTQKGTGTVAFVDNVVITASDGGSEQVDIEPGSCPNSFNRKSSAPLAVALVGSNTFHVKDVERESVYLMRADGVGNAVAPLETPVRPQDDSEDVAGPFVGEGCECTKGKGDGIPDLLVSFNSKDVVTELNLNDLLPGDEVELILTGRLKDGTFFAASDCIRVDAGEVNSTVEEERPVPGRQGPSE